MTESEKCGYQEACLGTETLGLLSFKCVKYSWKYLVTGVAIRWEILLGTDMEF